MNMWPFVAKKVTYLKSYHSILLPLWTSSSSSTILTCRSIHSGVTMTSQEVATALRPFIFTVHPDRFWNHPKEKTTNESSLKRLNEYLGDKNKYGGRQMMVPSEETITFYIRNNNTSSPSSSSQSSSLSSSTKNNGSQSSFEKVHIKLNSKECVSTTVHRILSQCSLPTDHLSKFKKQPQSSSSRKTNSWNRESMYRGTNEYFYEKEFFEDLEYTIKAEIKLNEWLSDNYPLALKKLEASLPIRVELTRLKQEIIDELSLVDLKWNCNWSVSHIRGALKNLRILANQYPEDFKKLRSKTIVFSQQSSVSFEGQVVFSITDVRNGWLYLIRSIDAFDYYVRNLPRVEKELSELMAGISIVHPEYNLWSAKKYHKQISRLTKSIRDYQRQNNKELLFSERLDGHRLIVESDSGPLMLSPMGNFIVPACCPISLLIGFLQENLSKATSIIEKDEFNIEYERILREECLATFELQKLDKEQNITPAQMIEFCRKVLDHKDILKNHLKDAHIRVTMYYTVMHDGQMCVPYNFVV